MHAKADKVLASLLERLDAEAEKGVGRATFFGRAVGRDKTRLWLATATGVVAIPLEQILELQPRQDDTTVVSVLVGSVDRVEQLLSTKPYPEPLPGVDPTIPPIPRPRPEVIPGWPHNRLPGGLRAFVDGGSATTTDYDCSDTTTTSGGSMDSTDDYICTRGADDLIP